MSQRQRDRDKDIHMGVDVEKEIDGDIGHDENSERSRQIETKQIYM